MGRLFWKFFFFFWLAQLTAGLGVGLSFWLKHQSQEASITLTDNSPPAVFEVRAAAATLRHGGSAALRALLEEQQGRPGPQVFVLVDQQQEFFGRIIAPDTLARLVEMEAAIPQAPQPGGIEQVIDSGGRHYLLFAPQHTKHREPPPMADDKPPPPHEPLPPRKRYPIPPAALVAGILVSLIFAALLAWYFAKPIRSLRQAFAAAATGRFEQPLAPEMGQRRDELADLGHDFDRMMQQLQLLLDGQRRLLHDVSHELRSPLSRLQAAIGLARQQPERADELLARIERESVRMDRLVSELLTLSRLEAGMTGQAREAVDLRELLATLIEDARFEAQARRCRVDYEESSKKPRDATATRTPLTVVANAELLHRALENVVRNALKHSPVDAPILIELKRDDARAGYVIRVSDCGQGVPETDLSAIFAPFFRCEKHASPDGYGLGLAISQRVLALYGGNIAASNRPDGGLCVSIFLPAHTTPSERKADAAV